MTNILDTIKEQEKDRESALVSIFAVHQTKDPENVIRESIKRILDVHDKRTFKALLEEGRVIEKYHYTGVNIGFRFWLPFEPL
jgi:hypothetical protein